MHILCKKYSFAGQKKKGKTTILRAGSLLTIKVLSVQPGNTIPHAITATQPIKVGGVIEGTISNTSISTQTVLRTQVGPIALNTANSLPVGTKGKFQIIEIQSNSTADENKAIGK